MKRFTKTMAALGLAAVMGTGSAFISLADVTTSVNPVATSRKSGWVDVQNHWYYFDANGNPVKNQWIQDGNNRYWMQEDGEMSKQKWVYTEGQWYWVNAQGARASNIWVEDGGSWYYMGGDGRMMTNTWLDYAGKWYYLTETGAAARGWKELGENGISLMIPTAVWQRYHGRPVPCRCKRCIYCIV